MTTRPLMDYPRLSQIIADHLFANGWGAEADHLVLVTRDGKELGGWCKQAVIDRIEEALAEAWNRMAVSR